MTVGREVDRFLPSTFLLCFRGSELAKAGAEPLLSWSQEVTAGRPGGVALFESVFELGKQWENLLSVLLHCLLVSYVMACPDYKTDFYNNVSYPNFGV